MADGFTRGALHHDDGVYLDLPLADYLADSALSGSAFKKLLSDPAGLYWESDANPLWLKPERRADRARLRGSAAHAAILEGLAVYAARYVIKPEGVLESSADLKRWLSNERARRIADSIDGKLSKEDRDAVKQTGEREDLVARILAIAPATKIWEPDEDTETLTPADDQYVRLLERFVRSDPTFAPLVSDGLPEVSIFWTEDGLRFKARIDYLTAGTVLDLKTFGQAPRRGRGLREHCVAEAAFNAYDLQAVHNMRAVEVAADRYFEDESDFAIVAGVTGAAGATKNNLCASILQAYAQNGVGRRGPGVFRWLFLRMGSGPTGISIPFRRSDGQWSEAERQIAAACDLYQQFRDAYGDQLWMVTHGEQEIQDMDWPLAAIRGAA
jgi:hypothetical protein